MNLPAGVNVPEPPRVGDTLLAIRKKRGLSLDGLSRKASVSKSMLSQIERNQTNPTIALIWRLSVALNVPISDFLTEGKRQSGAIDIVNSHSTPSIKSADGKCELRILGPLESAGHVEWYELIVLPGGILESQPHETGSHEHLSVLTGALDVRARDSTSRVRHGDTARYAADVPHAISNGGKTVANALLVVMHGQM